MEQVAELSFVLEADGYTIFLVLQVHDASQLTILVKGWANHAVLHKLGADTVVDLRGIAKVVLSICSNNYL